MATAEAQRLPWNWVFSRIAAGTSFRSIRRNPHDSARGAMVVVKR
jgi:hypothetical protein